MTALLSLIPTLVGKLLDWAPAIAAFFTGRTLARQEDALAAKTKTVEVLTAEQQAAAATPGDKASTLDLLAKGGLPQ